MNINSLNLNLHSKYVCGSEVGGKSRSVQRALKRRSNNNAEGKPCCNDANYNIPVEPNVILQFDSSILNNGLLTQSNTKSLTFKSNSKGYFVLNGMTINFNEGTTTIPYSVLFGKTINIYSTSITYIQCSSLGVSKLLISNLTALTYLDCSNNNISVLDVSKLTALTDLGCSNNNISVLDVSKLTALTVLACVDNNISVLDVSKLTALTQLECYNNNISELNVTSLTKLTYLDCDNNTISILNVTNLTELTYLRCQINNIIQSTADTIAGKIIANNISDGDMFILEQTSGDLNKTGNLLTLQDDYNWDIQ
jgi:hypothetical protein